MRVALKTTDAIQFSTEEEEEEEDGSERSDRQVGTAAVLEQLAAGAQRLWFSWPNDGPLPPPTPPQLPVPRLRLERIPPKPAFTPGVVRESPYAAAEAAKKAAEESLRMMLARMEMDPAARAELEIREAMQEQAERVRRRVAERELAMISAPPVE